MRIHLTLSQNNEIVPFNYQRQLTGVLHKWIGQNNTEHDETSLYSFSWLKNGMASKNGIEFKNGANWFISSFDTDLIKKIIEGIQNDPSTFNGMAVNGIQIQEDPKFENAERFSVASPVFVKRRNEEKIEYFYFDNLNTDKYLTETLSKKLQKAGLESEGISVKFDRSYLKASKKGITYNGIKSIGSICPVIIEGTSEQIAFAWNVGLGNSTGIGFGALK